MKAKKLGIIIISISIAAIIVVTFFINFLAFNKFDNILEQFIGKTADTVRGDDHGADTQYYKSSFDSATDLYEYEEDLVAEIAQEGATLLETKACFPSKGAPRSAFSAILRLIW